MQKALSIIKTVITLGWFGDFNVLRRLALRMPAFKYLYYLYVEKHQSYIPLSVKLESDVKFPHLTGIHITGGGKIGHQCVVYQQVTIGRIYPEEGKYPGCPTIGNNVIIGVGAKILGGITVGNNVKIGAGCIVVDDVPDNVTVVMNKPRIILKKC